jgi:hypothetical protein
MAIPTANSESFWYSAAPQNALTGQWNDKQKKDQYEAYALAQLRAKYENIGNEQTQATRIREEERLKKAQDFEQGYKMQALADSKDKSKAEMFTTIGGYALNNSDKLFGGTSLDKFGNQVVNKGLVDKAIDFAKPVTDTISNYGSKALTSLGLGTNNFIPNKIGEVAFDSSMLTNTDNYISPAKDFVSSLNNQYDFNIFSGLSSAWDSVMSIFGF